MLLSCLDDNSILINAVAVAAATSSDNATASNDKQQLISVPVNEDRQGRERERGGEGGGH